MRKFKSTRQAQRIMFVSFWASLTFLLLALVRGYRKTALTTVTISASLLLILLYTKSGQLLTLML